MPDETRQADERPQPPDLEQARFTVDWFLYGRQAAEFCQADRRHLSRAVDW